jgi:hypothetical protein
LAQRLLLVSCSVDRIDLDEKEKLIFQQIQIQRQPDRPPSIIKSQTLAVFPPMTRYVTMPRIKMVVNPVHKTVVGPKVQRHFEQDTSAAESSKYDGNGYLGAYLSAMEPPDK